MASVKMNAELSGYNRLGIKGMPKRVRIFDTTLRDGDQAAGVRMTAEDKVKIAKDLDAMGIDYIEAGFAASCDSDREALSELAVSPFSGKVFSLSRCVRSDIDAVIDCGVRNIHLFLATSDIHLKYKLNMTREEAIARIRDSVSYATSKGLNVMFSCEDATRTEYGFLSEAFFAAVESGASYVNIADTVGSIMPGGMYELVTMLKKDVSVPVSVHCHNDLGLAIANSLSAAEAGAEIVHTCVNGLGERAGNASTEEFALDMKLFYGIDTIDLSSIDSVCKSVSRHSGTPIASNQPLVGRNAFAHEAGIHVHGVLSNSSTYEAYPPEMIGRNRNISIGRHSGIHSIKDKLAEMRVTFPDDLLNDLLAEVKSLSDRGREITDIELAFVAENLLWRGKTAEHVKLKKFAVITGLNTVPKADVVVSIDGIDYVGSGTGHGPVDASVNAICEALNHKIAFEELKLESITGGSDSLCDVIVLVKGAGVDGQISAGKAVGLDIVGTTIDAFMQAVNRDYARGV